MPYKSSEIKKLAIPSNHKIKFDGYDYWWYSKIGRSWKLHCIMTFKDKRKALSYIKYWIYQYWNEDQKTEMVYSNMVNSAIDEVRIYDIVNDNRLKTIDKVIAILDLKPYLTQTEISEYLNLSIKAINKYFLKFGKKLSRI